MLVADFSIIKKTSGKFFGLSFSSSLSPQEIQIRVYCTLWKRWNCFNFHELPTIQQLLRQFWKHFYRVWKSDIFLNFQSPAIFCPFLKTTQEMKSLPYRKNYSNKFPQLLRNRKRISTSLHWTKLFAWGYNAEYCEKENWRPQKSVCAHPNACDWAEREYAWMKYLIAPVIGLVGNRTFHWESRQTV